MDENQALRIVAALADGVNPQTGEVFPADSPYQSGDIVRALSVARRILERSAHPASPSDAAESATEAAGAGGRARLRAGVPSNVGKPWGADEDRRLLAEFEHGRTPSELARLLGRTLAGIEARLEKLGRLTPQQRQTVNRYVRNGPGRDVPGGSKHA